MFGINHLKARPTQYVIQTRNGKAVKKGSGLSFWYYQPLSTIAVVPIASTDTPFIFSEISADFQPVTVQGLITYRIVDPELVASLLDYTVVGDLDNFVSDDPDKLSQRIVNIIQLLTRAQVQELILRDAILQSNEIAVSVMSQLGDNESLQALGVEIISFVIVAIKPTPDVARALEAESRENMLKEADDAVYERRNSAVDQERRIKENELNTEIAVEEKKRQIQETEMAAQIALENERKELIEARMENIRNEADANSYTIEKSLEPLANLSPDMLQALTLQSAEPRLMASLALRQLAENADKIGQLYITPDLLESLIRRD